MEKYWGTEQPMFAWFSKRSKSKFEYQFETACLESAAHVPFSIEGDSCLVDVNFIVKIVNGIHNYGRTNTLETKMENLNLICMDKAPCQTAWDTISQRKVGNKRKRLLMESIYPEIHCLGPSLLSQRFKM